eukprot:gnl/TRDRNA2_/TRDRNA2_129003_c0_seq1.p1 gnl/TRDRNA2_/TRDRNA2_129003_c0~~gnl/TRDRNA2_/TRDRNA2_129003_c0_seq1.p1  ORF type:complete len:189 (+),score=21.49 gnl/TRDRNA2_/TRDRNA2_129003_c0_seq1:409-975(+)
MMLMAKMDADHFSHMVSSAGSGALLIRGDFEAVNLLHSTVQLGSMWRRHCRTQSRSVAEKQRKGPGRGHSSLVSISCKSGGQQARRAGSLEFVASLRPGNVLWNPFATLPQRCRRILTKIANELQSDICVRDVAMPPSTRPWQARCFCELVAECNVRAPEDEDRIPGSGHPQHTGFQNGTFSIEFMLC